MNVEFRVDEATKSLVKVTESATTEAELRPELQAAADAAQNRLNAANEAKAQAEANLAAANEAVEAASLEVAAAETEVQFSANRLAGLDEALSVLASLVEPEPAAADAESPAPGEEVKIPVNVAEVAPA